ncbi:MAG: hypothetical protein R2854_20540 [Caldilineaceae bacterium]
MDRFAPWHRLFAQMPHAVSTGIAAQPALGDYFKTLQRPTAAHPPVRSGSLPAACRAAEPLARALQEGLLTNVGRGCHSTVEQWCNNLLSSLDSAHDAAQELMAMLDRVHQRGALWTIWTSARSTTSGATSSSASMWIGGRWTTTTTISLASEARLGSLVAIAKHDSAHQTLGAHLGRPLTVTPRGRPCSRRWHHVQSIMPRLLLRMPAHPC